MKLRSYQEAAVEAVFKEWGGESVSTLVVLPTGSGKTIVAAEVIRRMQPKRSIMIAHRGELLFQARDKIMDYAGLECEIEKAELVATTDLFSRTPVIIASVQTLISGNGVKRMERFHPDDFGLLVIDESHHCVANSYKSIINHFRKNPVLKVLNITATPDRADEKALGQLIDSVAYDYEIIDAIKDGWLVPIEQQMVHINGLDFSAIRTTAGDLNGADLAAVMEAEQNLQGIASTTVEIIKDRRAVVFAASVKQAEMLSNIFNRHRPQMADWVSGSTPQQFRLQTLTNFQSGKTQIIVNVGVLSEGWDSPVAQCIVMARPTKSRSLYAQQAGRALRPLPGLIDDVETSEERRRVIADSQKPSCLILDFCGNSGRHKLISTADILGGNFSDEAVELAARKAREKGVVVNMTKELEEAEEEIRKKIEVAREREESRKRKIVLKAKYTTQRISPFDALDLMPVRDRGWDLGRSLSEPQRRVLLKAGINPEEMTYAQGKQLVTEIITRWKTKRSTLGQCKLLRRFGYNDAAGYEFKKASDLITRIKENGWKKVEVTNANSNGH